LEVDKASKFIEWHNDEEIQSKIDLYGAGGTDLTDPKCGTSFYKNWLEEQKEKASKHEQEELIDEDQMKKKAKIYQFEIDRIRGKRALHPVI